MGDAGPLRVHGIFRMDPGAPSFQGAEARVRLEEVSYADAPARVLAEQRLEGLTHQEGTAEEIPFLLEVDRPEKPVWTTLRVHVDRDGSGEVAPGDLISMDRYPLRLTQDREAPDPAPQRLEASYYSS